jgi:hypothetical protein
MKIVFTSFILVFCIFCSKVKEFEQKPEIVPVEQGLQISALMGYCSSIAITAFKGETLPSNAKYVAGSPGEFSSSGIITVTIDQNNRLPFTDKTGQIIIAGLWDVNGGIISVAFGNLKLMAGQSKFYGLYTIPIAFNNQTGKYMAVFAQEDIVLGEGSDTILALSFTRPKFDTELDRLNNPQPTDMFVAASQNVWFVNIDQKSTPTNLYDDFYSFYGGGQIAEVRSNTGGILYHALIGVEVKLDQCKLSPVHGDAFIQNIKAGSVLDLGTIVMSFHSECDGHAYVSNATGKYFRSARKDITLNLH